MKALRTAIESNGDQAGQNSLSKRQDEPSSKGIDGIYARYRKLEQRLERVERIVSELRRDVYRVEKRQYRGKETPSLQVKEPEREVLPAGLFY